MRTTVDIPAELLEEAKKVSATRSIRELIRKGRREELRKLAGTMELKVELKRSRERKGK